MYSREVFFKSFGTNVEGNSYDDVDGYKADVVGFLVGADHEQANGSRIGVAYGYSNSDVSGKGTGQSVTTIDSHQVMIYGDYAFGNNTATALGKFMYGQKAGINSVAKLWEKMKASGLDVGTNPGFGIKMATAAAKWINGAIPKLVKSKCVKSK